MKLRILLSVLIAASASRAAPLDSVLFNMNSLPNTGTINSTGATLLAVICTVGSATPPTTPISDNKSNTWISMGSSGFVFGYYAYQSLSVGTSHTVTYTGGTAGYGCVFFAFSGFTGPKDKFSYSGSVFTTTINTGAIVPATAGSLIISGFYSPASVGPYTVDSSLSILRNGTFITGTDFAGIGTGYLVQGAASSINPGWTSNGDSRFFAAIAVNFPAAAVSNRTVLLLSGVGGPH